MPNKARDRKRETERERQRREKRQRQRQKECVWERERREKRVKETERVCERVAYVCASATNESNAPSNGLSLKCHAILMSNHVARVHM